jgi:hypothetical protein
MKRLKLTATLAIIVATVLCGLLLHTSGIRLGSKTYLLKLVTWPQDPMHWPAHLYHDHINGPTGSNESYAVFGVRVARWSWQFSIVN